jgi:hypothetical protein
MKTRQKGPSIYSIKHAARLLTGIATCMALALGVGYVTVTSADHASSPVPGPIAGATRSQTGLEAGIDRTDNARECQPRIGIDDACIYL